MGRYAFFPKPEVCVPAFLASFLDLRGIEPPLSSIFFFSKIPDRFLPFSLFPLPFWGRLFTPFSLSGGCFVLRDFLVFYSASFSFFGRSAVVRVQLFVVFPFFPLRRCTSHISYCFFYPSFRYLSSSSDTLVQSIILCGEICSSRLCRTLPLQFFFL